MHTNCVFCSADVTLVYVHGHYQCPLCKTNILPCCDADNCDDFLLQAAHIENEQTGLLHNKVINTGIKNSKA